MRAGSTPTASDGAQPADLLLWLLAAGCAVYDGFDNFFRLALRGGFEQFVGFPYHSFLDRPSSDSCTGGPCACGADVQGTRMMVIVAVNVCPSLAHFFSWWEVLGSSLHVLIANITFGVLHDYFFVGWASCESSFCCRLIFVSPDCSSFNTIVVVSVGEGETVGILEWRHMSSTLVRSHICANAKLHSESSP